MEIVNRSRFSVGNLKWPTETSCFLGFPVVTLNGLLKLLDFLLLEPTRDSKI